MVEHKLADYFQAAVVRFVQQVAKVFKRAVFRVNAVIVHDVIPVVPSGSGVHGHEPDAVDAEVDEVVETRDQSAEVPPAVPVAVLEPADVQLVND